MLPHDGLPRWVFNVAFGVASVRSMCIDVGATEFSGEVALSAQEESFILQPHAGRKLNIENHDSALIYGGKATCKLGSLHLYSMYGIKVKRHSANRDGPAVAPGAGRIRFLYHSPP